MEMSRGQRGLQAHCFDELRSCFSRLTLLRENGAQVVAEIGTLGSELHSPTQLRSSLNLRVSPAENAAQGAVSFCVQRSRLHGPARLALRLGKNSLLRKDTRQIQAHCDKGRPDPKSGFEMIHRAIQIPLLPQHPPQGGPELSITRRAAHRLLEIGAGRGQVALAKCLLSALISRSRR